MMMRGFLRYSEDIASYQKASYLAKAGAEVWFLLTNTTKANFDYTLGEEDKKKKTEFVQILTLISRLPDSEIL